MKTTSKFFILPAISVLLMIVMLRDGAVVAASEKSLLEEVKGVNEPFDSQSVKQVRPVTQKTVLAKEEYQGGSFRVLARKHLIGRYKCSSTSVSESVRNCAPSLVSLLSSSP